MGQNVNKLCMFSPPPSGEASDTEGTLWYTWQTQSAICLCVLTLALCILEQSLSLVRKRKLAELKLSSAHYSMDFPTFLAFTVHFANLSLAPPRPPSLYPFWIWKLHNELCSLMSPLWFKDVKTGEKHWFIITGLLTHHLFSCFVAIHISKWNCCIDTLSHWITFRKSITYRMCTLTQFACMLL